MKDKRHQGSRYRRLAFSERESISRWLTLGLSVRQIARRLARDHGVISREIKRGGGPKQYRALSAHQRAKRQRRQQGRKAKLPASPRLEKYVLKKLFLFWSPEQIANQLKIDYPEDSAMQISPETIYRHVYIQPKGEF